jgi:hypothetical protein
MGLMFLEACSGGGGGGSGGGGSYQQKTVTISPRPLAVQKGTSNTIFTAKDSSNQSIPQSSMTWSVDGTINGSIDLNTGRYTAPASVPPQNPVTVRAALVSDPSKNDAVSFYVLTGPDIIFSSASEIPNLNQPGSPSPFHIAVFNQNTYVTWATSSGVDGTHLWYSKNFSPPHDILPDLAGQFFLNPDLLDPAKNVLDFTIGNPVIAFDNTVDPSSGDPGVYIAWDDNSTGVYQVNLVKGPNSISPGCLQTIPLPPCFTPFALTGTGNAISLQVFPSNSVKQYPSLAMSPLGKLELAWTEVYMGTPISRLITYGELDSNGFLTNGPMEVTPSRIPNVQTNPVIEIDISGNVSISWIDHFLLASLNIFYSRLQSGQSVFDPEIQVETDVLLPADTFSMVLDYNGQPHLAWSETSVLNTTPGIYYSTYVSTLAKFIPPVKLTSDGSNGYNNPTIKIDLLNYLYLSWDDGMLTFFQKTGASPKQIVGVNPVMNIDDGGRVYLLYSTTGGSNPSTYYVKGD